MNVVVMAERKRGGFATTRTLSHPRCAIAYLRARLLARAQNRLIRRVGGPRYSFYLCARDRGCSVYPAFPAPSVSREGGKRSKVRTNHVARMRMYDSEAVPTIQ